MVSYSSPSQDYTSVDFTQLEKYLKAGMWRMADMETRKLIYLAVGMNPAEQASVSINQIPCGDLMMMDQLWLKYSRNKFGFSVQHTLLQPMIDKYYNKTEAWNRFGSKVGWRINSLFKQNYWKKHKELTFSLEAPVGHLPHLGDKFGILTLEALGNQLQACKTAIAEEPPEG